MTQGGVAADAASMVDLGFPLAGRALAADHVLDLQQSLLEQLPWLEQCPRSGIHDIRLASGSGEALLSQRSRLFLRVPRQRVEQVSALSGQQLQVGEHRLTLGQAYARELLPHATLYAHGVASLAGADELAFMAWVDDSLQKLAVRAHAVCGLHHVRLGPDGALQLYSLMLHGLGRQDALRILEQGLGPHRQLGCGLFTGHKSAAAVGDWQ